MSTKRYIGKVCSKHPELGGERHTSNNDCVGCNADRASRWAVNNKAVLTKYRAEYYKANKDKAVKRAKLWAEENPEQRKKIALRYVSNNKDRCNAATAHRRAMKKQATPSWSDKDHILGMYELCALFRKAGLDLEVDHIVPIRGKTVRGFHVAENLQLLHAEDNLKKGNRVWPHEVGYA